MNPMMPPGGAMPPSAPPTAPPSAPPMPPDGGAPAGPQIPPEVALAVLQALAAQAPDGGPAPDTSGIATPGGEIDPSALAYFLNMLGVSPEAMAPALGASAKLTESGVTPEDFGVYDDAITGLSSQLGLGGRQLDPQLLAMLAEALPENDPSQIPLPNSPQSYGA